MGYTHKTQNWQEGTIRGVVIYVVKFLIDPPSLESPQSRCWPSWPRSTHCAGHYVSFLDKCFTCYFPNTNFVTSVFIPSMKHTRQTQNTQDRIGLSSPNSPQPEVAVNSSIGKRVFFKNTKLKKLIDDTWEVQTARWTFNLIYLSSANLSRRFLIMAFAQRGRCTSRDMKVHSDLRFHRSHFVYIQNAGFQNWNYFEFFFLTADNKQIGTYHWCYWHWY